MILMEWKSVKTVDLNDMLVKDFLLLPQTMFLLGLILGVFLGTFKK